MLPVGLFVTAQQVIEAAELTETQRAAIAAAREPLWNEGIKCFGKDPWFTSHRSLAVAIENIHEYMGETSRDSNWPYTLSRSLLWQHLSRIVDRVNARQDRIKDAVISAFEAVRLAEPDDPRLTETRRLLGSIVLPEPVSMPSLSKLLRLTGQIEETKDATPLEEEEIQVIMKQAKVDYKTTFTALRTHGNIVDAILMLPDPDTNV
jgi:hypothetical protein